MTSLLDHLASPTAVLDHGFVHLVDVMGNDRAVVQAARVSYGQGLKSDDEDRALIRYLLSHRHTTPFEMCEIKLHVKMPIFVARQWIRHRTASVNEVSGRYTQLPSDAYVPDVSRVQKQSTANRQGSAGQLADAHRHVENFRDESDRAFEVYQSRVDVDMAKELARINLPVSTYTEWYWKIDLHNLLHFLTLRLDSHAQYEIRVYAEAIAEIVKAWVPWTWEAFVDYRLEAASFSRMELALLRDLLDWDVQVSDETRDLVLARHPDLTKRERDVFFAKLGLK